MNQNSGTCRRSVTYFAFHSPPNVLTLLRRSQGAKILDNDRNGQKVLSFRESQVWNELEHKVKLAPTLPTFKCRLKCE